MSSIKRYKRHNVNELFDGVRSRQEATIPLLRDLEPAVDATRTARDIAEHPECFVPGCQSHRVRSRVLRAGTTDGRLICCAEHRGIQSARAKAFKAKTRWEKYLPEHGAVVQAPDDDVAECYVPGCTEPRKKLTPTVAKQKGKKFTNTCHAHGLKNKEAARASYHRRKYLRSLIDKGDE